MRKIQVPLQRRKFLLGAAALGAGIGYAGTASTAALAVGSTSGFSGMTADGANRRSDAFTFTRSVGPFDVVALRDASGPFFLTRTAAFPDASQTAWNRAKDIDPQAFGPGETWNLDFHCFAIRRPGGRIILVDAGVGPDGSPASAWAPVPGHLPQVLAAAGIHTEDVDMVVLTHLHADHVGWSVTPDGMPMFPNARYLVQKREIAALIANNAEALLRYVVDPLRRSGQLHEVDGRVRVLSAGPIGRGGSLGQAGGRVTVIPTPGHTPGHQSVLVEGHRGQIVITGDVLVHAVQLVDPDVRYVFESDPEAARRSRRSLLGRARSDGAVLATAHLTRPFVPAR